jgi:muramoyltetrapeptide carboxypeptidase
MEHRLPTPCLPGDKIALIAPARKISAEELAPAEAIIKAWGYEPLRSPNLFGEDHQFSGSDSERLADLQWALDHPEIKAILCVRGGYGSVRLVDQIVWEKFLEKPKWLIGYSDVTVLHNTINNFGIASLHASMPINFPQNTPESLNSLAQALSSKPPNIEIKPHPFSLAGIAEGLLIGGNLSMLYSQCGSPSALETNSKILFFEDLDEYLYHIDRMMFNLGRNHYFDRPAAVIIGSLTDMNDNSIPFGENAEEIVYRHLKEVPYPVAFGLPAGHLDDNRALRFGATARLELGSEGGLLQFC